MSETTHPALEALRKIADLGAVSVESAVAHAAIPQLEALLRDDHANKAALSRIARAVCVTEVEEDGMRLVKPDDVAAAVERLIVREGKDDIAREQLLAALEEARIRCTGCEAMRAIDAAVAKHRGES